VHRIETKIVLEKKSLSIEQKLISNLIDYEKSLPVNSV